MKKLSLLLFSLSVFTLGTCIAQQNRAPSPACKMEQKVGLTDITVEYSRPGVKDRAIFADDGLVPYGKVWRTGANSATKITFSDGVKVGGKELGEGSYAILTIPDKMEWTVNFYPYEESGWNTYTSKDPKVSVKAKPQNLGNVMVESFLIAVGDLRDYSATLNFVWEHTRVSVPLEVN
jgi:hypothetical protein